MATTARPAGAVDTRPATALMLATYATGAVGIFLSIWGLLASPPTIALGTALAVGGSGLLSFLRHAVYHRADAVRMGWDLGKRNNFQIEVGLANLSWGVVGLAAALLGWGMAAQATTMLVMGGYMFAVAGMQWFWPGSQAGARRALGPLLGMTSYAVALLAVGAWAMLAAN